MDWNRDLGYQGLLVLTFFGIAVAGLLYAKKIEPVLMSPPIQVKYWNYRVYNQKAEPEILLDNNEAQNMIDYNRLELPFGTLE